MWYTPRLHLSIVTITVQFHACVCNKLITGFTADNYFLGLIVDNSLEINKTTPQSILGTGCIALPFVWAQWSHVMPMPHLQWGRWTLARRLSDPASAPWWRRCWRHGWWRHRLRRARIVRGPSVDRGHVHTFGVPTHAFTHSQSRSQNCIRFVVVLIPMLHSYKGKQNKIFLKHERPWP